MMKFILRKLFRLVGPVFLGIGLWVLYRELGGHHFADLEKHLSSFSKQALCLALIFTILNYLVLAGYEWLGLRYINNRRRYQDVLLVSFIANALGNNFGATAFSGTAIRYRMYSSWKLSALDSAKVILFYGLTFSIGLLGILGLALIFPPGEVLRLLLFNRIWARVIGVVLLGSIAIYLVACSRSSKSLRFKEWNFEFPSSKIAGAQIVFSCIDWMLASAVLYSLLPSGHGTPYFSFLCLFVLGQVVGMISQLPGGVGVFEAALITALSPQVSADRLFVSLLYYRLIYYLLPLLMALVLLSISEFQSMQKHLKNAGGTLRQILLPFVPPILSGSTFIAGAILLFSGATPAVGSRLALLDRFLPLPAIELSHFLGSIAGVGLLFLARGIQRRLDAAYYLTMLLLGLGVIFSIVKGFDYEEAVILSVMFLLILPCRSFFYRKASLFGDAFAPPWFISVIVVVCASIWLALFVFKHVEYSHDLWWRFSLMEDASRSLRASVGMIIFAVILSFGNLMRTASVQFHPPTKKDLQKVYSIVLTSKNTNSFLALMGDKSFLFSENGKAFLMYGVHGKSWVVLGDPIGDENAWLDLITNFRVFVDRRGGTAVFSQISVEDLPLYLDVGLALIKIGEEAKIPLSEFNLEGGRRKEMRHTLRHLEKIGTNFEIIPKEQLENYLSELRGISDAWLLKKNVKEKGFSLGFFNEEYMKYFNVAILKHQGRIVAFANLFLGAEKEQISVDLMRYHPDFAPSGAMDYLFLRLILWAQKEKFKWFDLGMAPLSGLENREFAPLWNRIGSLVFSKAEYFYNFEGLRAYKEKYDPVWKPKYIALPSGFSVPSALADIAALNAGGIKGVFVK